MAGPFFIRWHSPDVDSSSVPRRDAAEVDQDFSVAVRRNRRHVLI